MARIAANGRKAVRLDISLMAFTTSGYSTVQIQDVDCLTSVFLIMNLARYRLERIKP